MYITLNDLFLTLILFFPIMEMKDPRERFHPLWAHHEQKLASTTKTEAAEAVLMKMTLLENELMRQVGEAKKIGNLFFHASAEQEIAL